MGQGFNEGLKPHLFRFKMQSIFRFPDRKLVAPKGAGLSPSAHLLSSQSPLPPSYPLTSGHLSEHAALVFAVAINLFKMEFVEPDISAVLAGAWASVWALAFAFCNDIETRFLAGGCKILDNKPNRP